MIEGVITAHFDTVICIYFYATKLKLLVVFRVTVPCNIGLYDRRFGEPQHLHIHKQSG